jgi:hypothetical protein
MWSASGPNLTRIEALAYAMLFEKIIRADRPRRGDWRPNDDLNCCMRSNVSLSASPRAIWLRCVLGTLRKIQPRMSVSRVSCALLYAGMILGGVSVQAANWYVSSIVSSSGNGQSWATAWKNSNNIQWNSISPGDTIYFDGGSSGLSYGAFGTISASGTSGNYITIARSTESGRDGIVTMATPCSITGSYIKFDGGGYKQVVGSVNTFGGPLYQCGIVFTCNSSTGSFLGGQSVSVTGQRPWFRYCYFNGTYGAGQGNSFGARNSTGFVLDHSWFYQSSYEDQMCWEPSASGATVAITNCVFQDNNKPVPENPTPHRDILNTWTGVGGYNLYVVNCIMFNTPGHSTTQPQGDGFLLQDNFSGGAKLGAVAFINNVCFGESRMLAFGTQNSGANSIVIYNCTVHATVNGDDLSYSTVSPAGAATTANNIGKSSNPGFLNASNPLGADGIPFTADDGFSLVTGCSAINAGSNVGVPTDICGNTRIGNPDLGAYEYGSVTSTNPVISVSLNSINFGSILTNTTSSQSVVVQNIGGGTLTGTATVAAPYSIVSGGSYSLGANQSQTVTVRFSPQILGPVTNTVTFTGGGGMTARVSGIGINPPPTVSAITQSGSDVDSVTPGLQIYSGTVIQYSGSASDPNGLPLTWQWIYTVNGGSEVVFQSGTGMVASVSFNYATSTAGNTYVWKLRVNNGIATAESDLTVGVEATPPPAGTLTFPATSGVITAPFVITGGLAGSGYISQAIETSVSNGGQAVYNFTITNAGNYVIQATVNAANDGANSFYVNIDAQPQDPGMIWDITVTAGFEQQLVSWRGNGTDTSDQFVPQIFNLTVGTHRLIIVGREANTQLQSLYILQLPPTPQNLHIIMGP